MWRLELTDDEIVNACSVCGEQSRMFRCPAISRDGTRCSQVYQPDKHGTCKTHRGILDWTTEETPHRRDPRRPLSMTLGAIKVRRFRERHGLGKATSG